MQSRSVVPPMPRDVSSESFTGHARDGRFAGRVNVGQHKKVGLVEGAAKFVPKMLRARVAMRLEEDEEAVELATAGGIEGRTDFGGMMAVIVDDGDVVHHAFDVEAA